VCFPPQGHPALLVTVAPGGPIWRFMDPKIIKKIISFVSQHTDDDCSGEAIYTVYPAQFVKFIESLLEEK
jgi:hypothetical protein